MLASDVPTQTGNPRGFRFSLKWLLALPVLVAFLFVGYSAVDRWTAVPWAGPQSKKFTIKIVDDATGQPWMGARVTLFKDGVERMSMNASFGVFNYHGGQTEFAGHQSLVRDARRVRLGNLRVLITAPGFEDFNADAETISQGTRPDPTNDRVEFVARLKRIKLPGDRTTPKD